MALARAQPRARRLVGSSLDRAWSRSAGGARVFAWRPSARPGRAFAADQLAPRKVIGSGSYGDVFLVGERKLLPLARALPRIAGARRQRRRRKLSAVESPSEISLIAPRMPPLRRAFRRARRPAPLSPAPTRGPKHLHNKSPKPSAPRHGQSSPPPRAPPPAPATPRTPPLALPLLRGLPRPPTTPGPAPPGRRQRGRRAETREALQAGAAGGLGRGRRMGLATPTARG
jgi:hypothetical protein